MVDKSAIVVSIIIETHSFIYEYILWVAPVFLMHRGLLNMDMVMIIFCDFFLSSICIHDLNIHQSMGMLLQFLRVFPYAFKTSVCDRLRDF